MRDIPKNAAVRRVNELVKRARTVKVHALLCACLKKMMPSMFGKEKKQKELLKNLAVIFQVNWWLRCYFVMPLRVDLKAYIIQAVAQEHGISPGDFPNPDEYRQRLEKWTGTGRTLANLPKLNKELLKK